MPLLQAELTARLKNALPPSTSNFGALVLLNDTRSSFSFTSANVNAGTGVITIAGHNFLDTGNGTRVRFPTAAPGGLSLNTDYWIRAVSGSNVQVSATPGGAAITSFSSAGSGTMTLSDQALTALDQNLTTPAANNAQWLRKEVGARLSISTPADAAYTIETISNVTRAKVLFTALTDNTLGVATLVFTKALLLNGGTTVSGNATGTPSRWWEPAGSVGAGSAVTYILTAFESN